MNNILSEKEYQRFIINELVKNNGYIERKATSFDRLFAMDRELLFKFLWDTQSDTMEALKKIYQSSLEDTIVNYLNAEMTKTRGSLLSVLKHGIEISNYKLYLMYTKPAIKEAHKKPTTTTASAAMGARSAHQPVLKIQVYIDECPFSCST